MPALFLAPALLVFTWFKFIPMARGLQMSFYEVNFGSESRWVGLDNFRRVFADEALGEAALNTLLYVGCTVTASAFLACCWRWRCRARRSICGSSARPSSCPP